MTIGNLVDLFAAFSLAYVLQILLPVSAFPKYYQSLNQTCTISQKSRALWFSHWNPMVQFSGQLYISYVCVCVSVDSVQSL